VVAVASKNIGGNTAIALASEKKPLSSITFGEVCAAGDVPAAVVNILTGVRQELVAHMAGHMDVNAIVYCDEDPEDRKTIQAEASRNVKRVVFWGDAEPENPARIMEIQELKTTWHPVGF